MVFAHFAGRQLFTTFARHQWTAVNKFVWLKCRNFIGDKWSCSSPKKESRPEGGGAQRSASLAQTLRRSFRRRSLFGLGRLLFSFEIARPALSFFNFVGLFAHTSVFTSAHVFRFCVATMKVWARQFNIYLTLAATLALLCGCETDKPRGPVGALRVHIEANPDTWARARPSPCCVPIPSSSPSRRNPF